MDANSQPNHFDQLRAVSIHAPVMDAKTNAAIRANYSEFQSTRP